MNRSLLFELELKLYDNIYAILKSSVREFDLLRHEFILTNITGDTEHFLPMREEGSRTRKLSYTGIDA